MHGPFVSNFYTMHPELANQFRFGQVMIDGYHWEHRNHPGGGAAEFVFDSMALAESTPIGPGVRQRSFWQTMRPAMVLAGQQAANAGFGGVIQGQFLSQPLYDPYNNTYGNVQGRRGA